MKRRVLVVEDDAAISMALRDRLRSEGYAVECAGDGSVGFTRAVGAARDLLILDIMLPGKDGLEICRDIRVKGVHVKILMLTARGEIVDRDTLLDEVWGYNAVPSTRTVDIHVASLRKKLGDSRRQEIIITVRGQGYRLAE